MRQKSFLPTDHRLAEVRSFGWAKKRLSDTKGIVAISLIAGQACTGALSKGSCGQSRVMAYIMPYWVDIRKASLQ
ncbi:MAG: hypothetical protein M1470_12615 [Bacteroidetes bacterium]|nr:hypothetical protein [Bacteroidota bacterium]MCL5738007.1 hypothetical protein [Bacteroidota bacterium]